MNRPYRVIAAITLTTIVVCAVYCFGLAPLLEPAAKSRPHSPGSSLAPTPVSGNGSSEFADLFPAGSWQLKDPFSLRTDRGTVLFGDYKMNANGEIEVEPISIVVKAGGNAEKPGRVYVLDAPDGARLKFENGLDLSKNSSGLGKLLFATLRGQVEIESPPTSSDSDDGVYIVTRGIQIDQESINTAQTLEMHFGPHLLRGQDLKLRFLDPEQKLKTSGTMKWAFSDLEITQVDLVQFIVAGDGIELFGDRAKQGVEAKKSPSAEEAATPIEIRCQGRFKFDFLTMEASFRDQVEVLRLPVRGQADSLRCDLLSLAFQSAGVGGNGKAGFGSKFSPHKLTATGRPVVLTSPSVDVSAKAEEMEYWISSRKVSLKDSKLVTLTRGTSEFKSPTIEYTLAKEAKRLGRLHAKGRGELTAVDPRYPSRSIRAEWDQELKLEPEGELHRLEMRSNAGLFLAGDQHRFTAREMKLWLEENGTPVAVARSKPTRNGSGARRASWQEEELPPPKGSKKNAPGQGMMFDVRPRRMLAIGSVEAETPELKGSTQRMELIFNYPAAQSGPPAAGGAAPAASSSSSKARKEEAPPEAKYDLVGDFIKVEIDNQGAEEPTIREVTVHKNLRFERFDLTDPSAPPLRVSGDQFKLTGGIRGDAEVVISGSPAEVSAEAVSIEGPEIHLQQRKNRVYIEKPGKVTIRDLAGALSAGAVQKNAAPLGQQITPQLIEVTWDGRMEFDGKKVEFKQGVVTNLLLKDQEGVENEVEILSGSLEIFLNRPISLGSRANLPDEHFGEELGLDSLVFDQGVDVTNDAYDGNGRRTAFDQLHSRNLSYDHLSGGFKADGPGYVSSVRKGMSGGAGALAFPVGQQGGVKPKANKSGLSYLRVDFDGSITGNLIKRDLTFDRHVTAVYSPVAAWDSIIDPNHRGGLGDQGVKLSAEELSIFQIGETPKGDANFEFEAKGNVMVEGTRFIAYGARTSYTPAKQTVILEGDPRKDCEVHQLDERGQETLKQAAMRMTYQIDKMSIHVDQLRNGKITPPANWKSPGSGAKPGAKPAAGSKPPTGVAPTKPPIYRPGQR